MGGSDSKGGDVGIITVSGQQSASKIHPILDQLQALRQIPPMLQEGKDPAWRNLQQDLQLMHQKDSAALHVDAAALSILEKYKAWCKVHAAETVQLQDGINHKVDEVRSLSSKVIADLSRAATEAGSFAKHAELVEDLNARLSDLEQQVQACSELTKQLRIETETKRKPQAEGGKEPAT